MNGARPVRRACRPSSVPFHPSGFILQPSLAMLAPVFPKFRRRARPKRTPPAPPPPVALTLVAASYETGASVTLVFDRAVDAAGLDAGQVMVNDLAEAPGVQYVG